MNNKPFLLRPALKTALWGGTRLNDDFHLGLYEPMLAEAWVCSTHPDGQSTAEGIPFADVLSKHPEWLGTHVLQTTKGKPDLPILIKLIDAGTDLSIQVHPDDDYALKNESQLGKTEMWYVLSAKKDAKLVYGFSRDTNGKEVRARIKRGDIAQILNHVPVKKNDVFFIESGVVHSIGAGILLAEIQESSNVTYRLYDYDRIDRNGTKRELHIDKALQVANLNSSAVPRQPMRVLKYKNGSASELLTRCKYFQVERFLLNTEARVLADFQTESNSFHALLCTEGCGVLSGEQIMLPFFKGDCIFVPADSIPLKLHGRAELLNVSC